jgi:hypothetical protein
MKADYVTLALPIKAHGTSLQGYITTTYDKLVETFGAPNGGSGGKINCEWILKFPDGTIATIYDWKLPQTPKNLYNWHIGGHNKKAVSAVLEAM